MALVLEFEKPIIELENKIKELKEFTKNEDLDLTEEIATLTVRLEKLTKEVFENLTSWQTVQLARHPERPYTLDYLEMIADDFTELHGDRHFADDLALITGLATIGDHKVMILGHQKGRDMKENLERNFGCAHPEGYRKAMRLMDLAEKYALPVVTFIDTPGAYPGVGAEERGQAEAIAYNLREMAGIKVPILVFVIGEGGSGGALGIGVGDRVFVMENAYYSVISPEGCAAILWRDRAKAPSAAKALKLTAPELIKLGIIDGMIREPLGGAHRDPQTAAEELKKTIIKNLDELSKLEPQKIVDMRYQKFRSMGVYKE
ncbi:acetyl-CoA carboxylase carboxyltransferase subunit alpha [Candidatus Omnitrophota bacterium]